MLAPFVLNAVVVAALGGGPGVPIPTPASCLCESVISDECFSSAPVVFEGRATTITVETVTERPTAICFRDASDPEDVPVGCIQVRAVKDGCTPAARKRVGLRRGGERQPRVATTDDAGAARFCELDPGAYQVSLGATAPTEVALSMTEGRFVRLQAPPEGRNRPTAGIVTEIQGGSTVAAWGPACQSSRRLPPMGQEIVEDLG